MPRFSFNCGDFGGSSCQEPLAGVVAADVSNVKVGMSGMSVLIDFVKTGVGAGVAMGVPVGVLLTVFCICIDRGFVDGTGDCTVAAAAAPLALCIVRSSTLASLTLATESSTVSSSSVVNRKLRRKKPGSPLGLLS